MKRSNADCAAENIEEEQTSVPTSAGTAWDRAHTNQIHATSSSPTSNQRNQEVDLRLQSKEKDRKAREERIPGPDQWKDPQVWCP